MDKSYIESVQAHVDEGGKLSHQNAVDLLAEVAVSHPVGKYDISSEPGAVLLGDWTLTPVEADELAQRLVEAAKLAREHTELLEGYDPFEPTT